MIAERAAEAEKLAQEASKSKSADKKEGSDVLKIYRSGVGKYLKINKDEKWVGNSVFFCFFSPENIRTASNKFINSHSFYRADKDEASIVEPAVKKKKVVTNSFGNFSSW